MYGTGNNGIGYASANDHVEELLIESEARMAALLMNLQTSVLFQNEYGKIVLINREFCDMFEIYESPEFMVGADVAWLNEQYKGLFKNPTEFLGRVHQLLSSRTPVFSEELLLEDGRILERDHTPLFVHDKYKGCLWKYSDITSKRKFAKTLKMQEEKYHTIISNMNLGLMEVDKDDVIQSVNTNFCDISGYTQEELIGRTSMEILQYEGNRKVIEQKQKINKYGIIDIFQMPVLTKNGEERAWLMSDAPIYDEAGNLKGLIGIHFDISDQKKMEKELEVARKRAEESSKAKESFLANMSHEIRTPLNGILGMIRELTREKLNNRQRSCVNNAQTSAQHLLALINNILDMSKIGAGEFKLEHRHFNLRTVVEQTMAIVSADAKEKMLDFQVNIARSIADTFIGDPTRLRQILINLVGNSIKFTDKGGIYINCDVETSDTTSQLINISIADTGIGMEEYYMRDLFNKFSQEDRSTSRRYGGSGLGMAITYELVQLMSGKIDVMSEKGKGTNVDIFLPLMIGDPDAVENENSKNGFEKLSKIRVLLVEDNEMNRLVASNSLALYDVNITEAENGLDAIEKIKTNTYDIILMDLQMPVIDGILATKIIREVLKVNTPIIALTANAFLNQVDLSLAAGMNDYIAKPFEENVLLGTIMRNLGKEAGVKAITKPKKRVDGPEEKLYDLATIYDLSRGDKSFVVKIIEMFTSDTNKALTELKNGYRIGDLKTVHQAAHRIKPGCGNMGIKSLKEDVLALEKLAVENPNSNMIPVLMSKVDNVLTKVLEQMGKEKAEIEASLVG